MINIPQHPKILAFVGMAGSGKSEAATYAQKVTGLPVIYFGQLTRDEVKKRGLELTPANERIVREDLRREFGMDVYAKRAVPVIRRHLEDNGSVLIDGLYSLAEWELLIKEFPQLAVVAILASPAVRYERLRERSDRPFSKDEARERDINELRNLEKGGPLAMATHFIINDETKKQLDEKVHAILEKEELV